MKSALAKMAFALASLGFVAGAALAEPIKLTGRWILSDGAILVIRGGEWFHPKFGTGMIKPGKGAANYDVYYTKQPGVRCAYRVSNVAGGEILVLETADPQQSPDMCPSGKLSRVSN